MHAVLLQQPQQGKGQQLQQHQQPIRQRHDWHELDTKTQIRKGLRCLVYSCQVNEKEKKMKEKGHDYMILTRHHMVPLIVKNISCMVSFNL